jgi:hypothetical protein
MPRHHPDRQPLFDLASEQHGYFTIEQAAHSFFTYHRRRKPLYPFEPDATY